MSTDPEVNEHDFCACHRCSIPDPDRYWERLRRIIETAPTLPDDDGLPELEPLL